MFYVLLPDIEHRNRALADMAAVGVHATFHYVPLHSLARRPQVRALARRSARHRPGERAAAPTAVLHEPRRRGRPTGSWTRSSPPCRGPEARPRVSRHAPRSSTNNRTTSCEIGTSRGCEPSAPSKMAPMVQNAHRRHPEQSTRFLRLPQGWGGARAKRNGRVGSSKSVRGGRRSPALPAQDPRCGFRRARDPHDHLRQPGRRRHEPAAPAPHRGRARHRTATAAQPAGTQVAAASGGQLPFTGADVEKLVVGGTAAIVGGATMIHWSAPAARAGDRAPPGGTAGGLTVRVRRRQSSVAVTRAAVRIRPSARYGRPSRAATRSTPSTTRAPTVSTRSTGRVPPLLSTGT